MIPDEAIEAAHKAWREQAKQGGSIFEYNLRAALEAAAPFIAAVSDEDALRAAWDRGYATGQDGLAGRIAEVWDEGRKHGATYPYGERGLATDDNPYRKA